MNHSKEQLEKMISEAKIRLANPDLSANSIALINQNIREWQQEIDFIRK